MCSLNVHCISAAKILYMYHWADEALAMLRFILYCLSDNLPLLSSKVDFPILEPRPFPSWISVIIFILAGIPSLSIPVFAIYKFIQRRCCKKDYSDDSVRTISAKIGMNEKTF